jgi:hypothetical protein
LWLALIQQIGMNSRHASALALVLSVFGAFSCSSQSHQQRVQRRESTIATPTPPQANAGTAACAGVCSFIGLYDQAPGCYIGIIPKMKSHADPPAGHAVWEYSLKEGAPFPEGRAELCIESDQLGTELHTVNVTSSSTDWNSFFDDNRLALSTAGDGFNLTFHLTTEGYLRGVATWVRLEWTCKTTIPDHKRLLCRNSWTYHTGPELDVGPGFSGQSDRKVMYYIHQN